MKKKRGSKKQKMPQPGDADYLSPTQLRNRRKRRAKQLQKQQQGKSPSHDEESAAAGQGNTQTKKDGSRKPKDPSMQYIANPTKAPIVQAAQRYFRSLDVELSVHVGPLDGWRTVAKLAVRPDPASATPKVAIGLFAPQSHELLSVPNCRAHHPSINAAVRAVTRACHEVGVVPYQEKGEGVSKEGEGAGEATVETGSGQLRYVAINVARENGAVQLTLVWNSQPPTDAIGGEEKSKRKRGGDIEDPVLDALVKRIVALSDSDCNGDHSAQSEKDRKAGLDSDGKSSDEPAPKKKRRRGRREGNSEANDGSKDPADGSNRNGHRDTSPHAEKGSGKGKRPKLRLHSLWVNYNESWRHSNAIFAFDPGCWRHVCGPRAITEHLTLQRPPGFRIPLTFPPNVFRQANLDAFTNIVGRIRERVIKLREEIGDVACVELYGGVGTIGLHLADAVSSLVSSDENPNNADCFRESVRALPNNLQPRLSYVQKNAAAMVASEPALFRKSQALIVDPPRKGLDQEVVDHLCRGDSKATQLVVYVSCGFRAFQRDCDALLKSGRWSVESAEGHLLFPGSDAIETLAFFVRKESD
ncbi:hypothetical protein ACHAXT_005384 [Thalassiosira profunda]